MFAALNVVLVPPPVAVARPLYNELLDPDPNTITLIPAFWHCVAKVLNNAVSVASWIWSSPPGPASVTITSILAILLLSK